MNTEQKAIAWLAWATYTRREVETKEIITALALTAYVLFLRRYGAEPSVMTGLLIVMFSGGIGYFLRGAK